MNGCAPTAANERGEHYLARPGRQDITTDVPFDQLPEPDAVRSQAQWLRLHGIDELVEEGRAVWTEQARRPDLEAMRMRSRVERVRGPARSKRASAASSSRSGAPDPPSTPSDGDVYTPDAPIAIAEGGGRLGRGWGGRNYHRHMAEDPDARHDTIDALQAENRKFPPSEAFKADALVVGTYLYDEAAQDDEAFWANQAAELVDWVEPWHTTLDWQLRMRGGSTAARSTCRSTASTGTCWQATAPGLPCTGKANPATPARSRTPNCSTRCPDSPTS